MLNLLQFLRKPNTVVVAYFLTFSMVTLVLFHFQFSFLSVILFAPVLQLEVMENRERKDLLQMETDLQGHINLHVRDDEGSRNLGFVPNTPDASSTVSTAHNLLDGLEEPRSDSNVVESANSKFGTGIKIRTRQPRNQESAGNVASQGNASRRIRLQKKLQIGPVLCSHETGLGNSKARYEEKTVIDEVKLFPSSLLPF